MSSFREKLHRKATATGLLSFSAIFEAVEGFIYGPSELADGAPHIHDHLEIKRFMSMAIVALLPTTVAAVVFWGPRVLLVVLVSYLAGGLVEVAFAALRKRPIEEGFLVTGLIFPLVLPPTVPLWIVAVGIIFGVFFGKEVFGGTGRNIFNPALVGRLFITIAFPKAMSTSWQAPFTDAITSATPLSLYKTGQEITPYVDLLFGNVAGSMGEVFSIGIIVGGIFLLLTRVGNWRIPVFYVGSVFVLSLIGNIFLPELIAPPLFQVLAGSLLFGAFFMVTDPVTSPYNNESKIIFGVFAGFLTIVIRSFSGYTEGVMFSIILMNALAPLIDHFVMKAKYKPLESV
ncbi:MAG: RnfABCDGE type electron transport complex subunit D [Alkalispirochaeta sp.]